MKKPQGLVFISIPIVGHLIPMVALAKRLIPTFSVTILTMQAPIPSWSAASATYLHSIRSSSDADVCEIHFVDLPSVEFSIDDNHHAFTTMSLFIDAHKDHVKRAIQDLDVHVVGVVTDFVTSMIDAAKELGIPGYVYFPSSAACLSVMVHPPSPPSTLDELVEVIGISPIPAHALPSPMTDPDGYDTFTYHGRRFNEAKGIIVNTFKELEPMVVDALSTTDFSVIKNRNFDPHFALPPIYTVGPMLAMPTTSKVKEKHECIKWLDAQPDDSVVFLCFGSMGCFEPNQVSEMAMGLEKSGHRFLWILRSPSDMVVRLPEGFSERTRDKGLVWTQWAPQIDILQHKAVGGFVTHCGWNSCLEGVWAGVPMLAWPLYAEQKFNACEMVKDMGVALELKISNGCDDDDRLFEAKEVERGVRCLMGEFEEGKKVRTRVKEMRDESRKAVGTFGSSTQALECWIQELTQEIHLI